MMAHPFTSGPFDPMDKREADEPYFTLLARDPAAAILVEVWAHVRSGNMGLAHAALERLDSPLSGFDPQMDHDGQIRSAMGVANQMTGWRLGNLCRPDPEKGGDL
ncbi:MAG: hypothetical protein COA84_07690 [Robiginitomaculum sp.]|nr:MAG: hypothetical protein COA84_07690 [Robiginitomaculum sp.]